MIARTSKERRGWIAWYYANGQNVSRTCREFGIARATLYKWLDRYDPDRPSRPLREASRRPHKTKPKTWGRLELELVAQLDMQTGGRLGAIRMTQALAQKGLTDYSRATVGRMLAAIYKKCPMCWSKQRMNHDVRFHTWRADYNMRFRDHRKEQEAKDAENNLLYNSGHKTPDDVIRANIEAARKTKLRLGT